LGLEKELSKICRRLERGISPHEKRPRMLTALEPFMPSPGDTRDAVKAGHLLQRAGFGPLPLEVAGAVG